MCIHLSGKYIFFQYLSLLPDAQYFNRFSASGESMRATWKNRSLHAALPPGFPRDFSPETRKPPLRGSLDLPRRMKEDRLGLPEEPRASRANLSPPSLRFLMKICARLRPRLSARNGEKVANAESILNRLMRTLKWGGKTRKERGKNYEPNSNTILFITCVRLRRKLGKIGRIKAFA